MFKRNDNNYTLTKAGELATHIHQHSDSLARSASDSYIDIEVYQDVLDKIGKGAAEVLARRAAIKKAKQHQWYRRTYSRSYCNRSECGNYVYMKEGHEFTGRMEPNAVNTWHVGGDSLDRVESLTIQISHKKCTQIRNETGCEGEYTSFLAAIRTVDCDGITIDVSEVYGSHADAAKAADSMAERECEVLREDGERFQQEQRKEEISEQLVTLRRDVLKLIKHIKPIRCDIPSAIVMCVMDKITDMLAERKNLFNERNQLPG